MQISNLKNEIESKSKREKLTGVDNHSVRDIEKPLDQYPEITHQTEI